jgi:tRNA-Thr(GGU) m(6)t(6)A37 methyltransferase TsaA
MVQRVQKRRCYTVRGLLAIAGIAAVVSCGLGSGKAMAVEFVMTPVGKVVKSSEGTFLKIFEPYRDALLGLDDFSYVMVFFWFDRNDTPERRTTLRVHPRRDKSKPLRGVFATRSPQRPNLIGFCVCRIKAVKDDRIEVDKIDAFDNTPIVDLKPYIPAGDSFPDANVPSWVGSRSVD